MAQQEQYSLYKGLQRPLVFKMFKGKYIYWAMGSIIAGVIVGGALSAMISSYAGIIAFAAITLSLIFYTISRQKQGLNVKKRERSIFIVQSRQTLSKKAVDENKKDI
jgi:uncharacterized membrane protein YfcA